MMEITDGVAIGAMQKAPEKKLAAAAEAEAEAVASTRMRVGA